MKESRRLERSRGSALDVMEWVQERAAWNPRWMFALRVLLNKQKTGTSNEILVRLARKTDEGEETPRLGGWALDAKEKVDGVGLLYRSGRTAAAVAAFASARAASCIAARILVTKSQAAHKLHNNARGCREPARRSGGGSLLKRLVLAFHQLAQLGLFILLLLLFGLWCCTNLQARAQCTTTHSDAHCENPAPEI